MRLFWVKINAEPLHVKFDGVEELCGFYKNEYVFAHDPNSAKTRAAERVALDLKSRAEVRATDLDRMNVKAEAVVPTWRLWKILFPGGYIFYSMEPDERAA